MRKPRPAAAAEKWRESLTQIPREALASLLECTDQPIRKELVGRLITRVQEDGKLWYYFSCSLDLGS